MYFPTRYVLTRTGLQVVEQLKASSEHSYSSAAQATAA